MDWQNFGAGFNWISAIVAGFLSLLGVGTIFKILVEWWLKRKDNKDEGTAGVEIERIKQKGVERDALLSRLERLENKVDKLQEDLANQMVTNAELKATNSNLLEDKTRNEKEIMRLRDERNSQEKEIQRLRDELKETQSRLNTMIGEMSSIREEMSKLGIKLSG